MRNKVCKPKNVNCAILFSKVKLILEAKIHEQSEWILASTQYERLLGCEISSKPQNSVGADSISARFAPTLAINIPPHFAITTERTSPI